MEPVTKDKAVFVGVLRPSVDPALLTTIWTNLNFGRYGRP